jgi:hypothetical protein
MLGAGLGLLCGTVLWFLISVVATLLGTPGRLGPAPQRRWRRPTARLAYVACIPLTLLRLPYAVIPHLLKVAILLVTGPAGDRSWSLLPVQLIRTLGDWVNLIATGWVLTAATGLAPGAARPASAWQWLALISTAAEILRLFTEKGQMLFSAGWQSLPHRALADGLERAPGARSWVPIERYCRYYRLNDDDRARTAHRWLVSRCQRDPQTAHRLGYTSGVRLVDPGTPLWSGVVRDVATGEVLAHPRWTADPGLLVGQLLRRGPWIFDPRLQPRPTRYRTGSNVAMTMMVLENADLLGAYGIYQWGNQIKVARYEIFHQLCRAAGLDREPVLRDDGSFDFSPPDLLLLRRLLGTRPVSRRALWTDAEVLALLKDDPGPTDPPSIARRFCYPERYVREVLLPALNHR